MKSRSRFFGAAAVALSVCCMSLAATAAPAVRTIQSSGRATFNPVGQGVDGVQDPELAPTLANAPALQDGPRAAADSGAGAVESFLGAARARKVNRSIARAFGLGELVAGETVAEGYAYVQRSFDGLSMRDSRLADGGNAFSVEPPDQGLCVGNGFVVESVNDAIRVFDRDGRPLTGVTSLNRFYGYPPAVWRGARRVFGPSLTDPSCYYDPSVRRFFHVVLTIETDPATGKETGTNHLDLAVSSSADPRDSWTIYRIAVQNDGTEGTPVHAHCPCLGDYPHIGADEYGVYLTTNEFPFSCGFNSAQIYALAKRALVGGTLNVTLVQIDTIDHLLEGNPGFTLWPAVSPSADFAHGNRGSEFLVSSLAVFADSGTDDRLRVWAIGNTQSLDESAPDLTLIDTTVQVRSYGVPPPSKQRSGPTPLADCLNDTNLTTPFGVGCWNVFFSQKPKMANAPEAIDSNDSRVQQVVFAGGTLYTALDTAVGVGGGTQAGIAYYALRPYAFFGSLIATMMYEGKVALAGNNVSYPAITALPDGTGVIAFTLVGLDHFPSAAYVSLRPGGHRGPVRVVAEGRGPDDGFSGYAPFGGAGVGRWGDYGAAVADGTDLWLASEYIGGACSFAQYATFGAFGSCGGTRVSLGNWFTRISRIVP